MNRSEISPARAELIERVSEAIKMSQISVAICLDLSKGVPNQIGSTKAPRGKRERPIYVTVDFREEVRPGFCRLVDRIRGCLIDLREDQVERLLRLRWQPAQPKNLIEAMGKLYEGGKNP